MRITSLIVVALMLLASNLLAADFVELKDVSGKHIIKVEINKVTNGKVQVTDEKGKTAEYSLGVFDRGSLILILNAVAKMKDIQKPNDPMDPPNPFNDSTIVAADFVELKDVSGKHIIKVEINSVANVKVQVTNEKGKTSEYPLAIFDRNSLILILNVVTKMKDSQKPNDPMDPPNPFNNPSFAFEIRAANENVFPVENLALETRDGVLLSAKYFPGTKGKEAVPIIMLHSMSNTASTGASYY